MVPKTEKIIARILDEYSGGHEEILSNSPKVGFMYGLRHRHLNMDGYERFIKLLDDLFQSVEEREYYRVVNRIYDYSFLISVWKQGCIENGADPIKYSEVERVVHRKIGKIISKSFN